MGLKAGATQLDVRYVQPAMQDGWMGMGALNLSPPHAAPRQAGDAVPALSVQLVTKCG